MLPLQGEFNEGNRIPRALPWAKVCWPFRPYWAYDRLGRVNERVRGESYTKTNTAKETLTVGT